jgi:hypothetical protein
MTIFSISARAEFVCRTFGCQQDLLTRKALSGQEVASLSQVVRNSLQNRAEALSGIWGDTILEGDYYADEDVQIDKIESLYKKDEFVGYRITYSSKAWDTSTCQFDGVDLTTLESCLAGRIQESGFVSADFKRFERDHRALAEFVRGAF